jgi:hypothetical protein
MAVVPAERSEGRDPNSSAELRNCGVWVPAFAGTTVTHSTFAPTSCTTLPHFAASAAM